MGRVHIIYSVVSKQYVLYCYDEDTAAGGRMVGGADVSRCSRYLALHDRRMVVVEHSKGSPSPDAVRMRSANRRRYSCGVCGEGRDVRMRAWWNRGWKN